MRVMLEDEELALWRVQGRVYAIRNRCPHQQHAVLHQAIREGLQITCPMHGWTFDLATGRAVNGDGAVRTYAVRIDGDDILVNPG